jgi:hypothetical protein
VCLVIWVRRKGAGVVEWVIVSVLYFPTVNQFKVCVVFQQPPDDIHSLYTMAQVVQLLDAPSSYKDSRSEVSTIRPEGDLIADGQIDRETERRLLSHSTTLYVGNLSFYTTEAQMYECRCIE